MIVFSPHTWCYNELSLFTFFFYFYFKVVPFSDPNPRSEHFASIVVKMKWRLPLTCIMMSLRSMKAWNIFSEFFFHRKCLKILNSFPFTSAHKAKRVSLIWNIFIIRKIYIFYYLWSLLLIFSHNMHSMLFLLLQTAVLFKATKKFFLYQSEWNKLANVNFHLLH